MYDEAQLATYLRVFSAEWGILTDGREFWCYRYEDHNEDVAKLAELTVSDLPDAALVSDLHRSAFVDEREESQAT